MRGKRAKALRREAKQFRGELYFKEKVSLTKKQSEKVVKNAFRGERKPKKNFVAPKERVKKTIPMVERVPWKEPLHEGAKILIEERIEEEDEGWDN